MVRYRNLEKGVNPSSVGVGVGIGVDVYVDIGICVSKVERVKKNATIKIRRGGR